MSLLFDGVHATSDLPGEAGLAELYRFARVMRLRRTWLQRSNSGVLHFDVFGRKARALTVNCKPREIVERGLRGPLPFTLGHQHSSLEASLKKGNRRQAAYMRRAGIRVGEAPYGPRGAVVRHA